MTARSLPRARHGAFALVALLSACGPEAAAPAELLPWMLGYKSRGNDVGVLMEDAYTRIIYVREDGTGYIFSTEYTSHEPLEEDAFRIEAIPRSRDEFWVVRAADQPRPGSITITEDEAWRFRRLEGDCGPFEWRRVDRSTGRTMPIDPLEEAGLLWWPGKLCVEWVPNCCPYDGQGEPGCECSYLFWCEDGLPPDGCPGGPPITSHNVP